MFEKAARIATAKTENLAELIGIAGGDADTFLKGGDLSGADLRGQDLRGINLAGARLDGVLTNGQTKTDLEFAETVFAAGIATLRGQTSPWITLRSELAGSFEQLRKALIAQGRQQDAELLQAEMNELLERETLKVSAGFGEPPRGFDRITVQTMILSGVSPERSWWPWIKELSFEGQKQFEDLGLLVGLTALQTLDLSGTGVSDIASLKGLTALQALHLRGTRVSDIAPLAGLKALQALDLRGTRVSDIAPLASLKTLQSLNLSDTEVSDIAPLKGLTALQELDLMNTRMSDIAPLAGLTALHTLILWGTEVSDIAPLAGLKALHTLDLSDTEVSDIAPLKGLTALQELDLRGTRVSDIAPLVGLTSLEEILVESDERRTALAAVLGQRGGIVKNDRSD